MVSGKLMRRGAIGALAVGMCVSAAGVAQAAATRLPHPFGPRVVHVTEHDNNRTLHVHRGTHIDVDLHGSWDAPTADNPKVLRENRHRGGYPEHGDAMAWFTAVGVGSAAITSASDMGCMHTNPRCMIATMGFRINVVVDGTGPRTLGESDNHHVITVHRGQSVQLLLHSTYWTIADPRGRALIADGPQVTTAQMGHCVPGAGCGTAARTFHAQRLGTAHLTARRTSCGEAMRCVGGNGRYEVTVLVVH